MKVTQKDSEKVVWDHQMRSPSATAIAGALPSRGLPKLLAWLIVFVFLTYTIYTVKLLSSSRACANTEHVASTTHLSSFVTLPNVTETMDAPSSSSSDEPPASAIQNHTAVTVRVPASESPETPHPTDLRHVVFGIAASAKLWDQRKEYIKLWYRPKQMRGIVWLDHPVKTRDAETLPPVKISSDTSRFKYTNKQGHKSAIRISRIVSETVRLGMEGVRWFVMCDDDTVFVADNLMRVLNKYDHRQYYYIGSLSESHLQNIFFSYGMAYGGGGFAISYPLAVALEKMQDRCIQRYPSLYGSDDRIQACMAELGVPLTKEHGFHQYDVYGNLFGLLTAHPLTPLVSLHHLDVVEPIFPNTTRVESLQRLSVPIKIDSAGVIQQSICYEKSNSWTVSVSWGYAIQIVRGIMSPREMEMPTRTFLNWYKRADYTAYAFNTRPVARNPCQKPYVFYMSKMRHNETTNQTWSQYKYHPNPQPLCKWKMENPSVIKTVEVYKKPDPTLWDRSPRRNCCRVMEAKKKKGKMVVEVGVCREGEIIGI